MGDCIIVQKDRYLLGQKSVSVTIPQLTYAAGGPATTWGNCTYKFNTPLFNSLTVGSVSCYWTTSASISGSGTSSATLWSGQSGSNISLNISAYDVITISASGGGNNSSYRSDMTMNNIIFSV